MPGACPPYGIQFFRFHIHFHQKVPTSEVHAPRNGCTPPLREILDPPLVAYSICVLPINFACTKRYVHNMQCTTMPINLSSEFYIIYFKMAHENWPDRKQNNFLVPILERIKYLYKEIHYLVLFILPSSIPTGTNKPPLIHVMHVG